MENNSNNIYTLRNKSNCSYSSLKKFVNNFFEEISQPYLNQSKELLNFIIHVIESLEFPFVILLNEDDKMAILISLYYEETLTDLIIKLLKKCVEKFQFEEKPYTSIEIIINTAHSLNIPIDNKIRNMTNLEKIYLEYKSLMHDCNFFKNYLEEIINEEYDELSLLEILKRVKQMLSTNFNVNDSNYPMYVYDFLQHLSENLSNYEDYFIKKLREIKKDSLYTPFSSFIQNKQTPKTEQTQIDIRYRTSFYYNEVLAIEEGLHVEFKNYRWPLSSNLIETLKNQICGFLNSQGGRVYIGVNDDRIVKGVYLKPKKKDLIRNQIINYSCDFWPKCRTSKLEITFIPVKSKEKYLEHIYVIKIIVKQGDPNKLYSTTAKGFNAYVRLPGQCVLLTAEETVDEILKRRDNHRNLIDEKAFIDPQPENPNENLNQNDSQNIKSLFKQLTNKNVKNNMLCDNKIFKSKNNLTKLPPSEREMNLDNKENNLLNVYTLSIQNIPTTATKIDILKLFDDTNYSSERIFVDKNGYCLGWGFFNYSTKTAADNTLKKLKNASISGEKLSVKMKIKNEK